MVQRKTRLLFLGKRRPSWTYSVDHLLTQPSGKVFVFSGILPICNGDDGLATVLGHEIAHTVAHHSAERMSQAAVFITPISFILRILFPGDIFFALFGNLLLDLGFARPGSRKQEVRLLISTSAFQRLTIFLN